MAFFFYFELVWCQARGYIRQNLRKLTQIKYLLGLALSLIFFIVILWLLCTDTELHDGAISIFSDPVYLQGIHFMTAAILAVGLIFFWLAIPGKFPLALTNNEYNVLQTAPLSRRSLIQFVLIKSQKDNLTGSIILWLYLVLYFRQPFIRFLLTWLLLHVLIDLHLKCCRFWKFRNSCQVGPRPVLARILLLVFLAASGWLLFSLGSEVYLSVQSSFTQVKAIPRVVVPLFFGAVYEVIAQSDMFLLLAPFLYIVAPFFPGDTGSLLLQYLVLFVLLGIHWEWLVRAKMEFGELLEGHTPSVQNQRSVVSHIGRKIAGNHRSCVPFRLPATGAPEWALYWKHFLAYFRLPWKFSFLLVIIIPLLYFAVLLITGIPLTMTIITAVYSLLGLFFGLFIFVGMFQKDLQNELDHFDLVRTFPLTGQQILKAKVLAISTWSALLGVLLLGLFAASVSAMGLISQYQTLTPQEHDRIARLPFHFVHETGQLLEVCFGILLAYVGFVSLIVLMLTFLNLFFPGWIPRAKRRENISSVGQSLLMMITLFLISIVCVLPAGLVIGAIAVVQYFLQIPFGLGEVTLFGFIFMIVSGLETFLLLEITGKMWDRIDPVIEQL